MTGTYTQSWDIFEKAKQEIKNISTHFLSTILIYIKPTFLF